MVAAHCRGAPRPALPAARALKLLSCAANAPGGGEKAARPEEARRRQGLYVEGSTLFPKPEPQSDNDRQEQRFWTERVLREWSGGAPRRRHAVATRVPMDFGRLRSSCCVCRALVPALALRHQRTAPRLSDCHTWELQCYATVKRCRARCALPA